METKPSALSDSAHVESILPEIYDELRRLAATYLRGERSAHTLQPTALVHEAYVRLTELTGVEWRDPKHFFAAAAGAMRRVLVDHARQKSSAKRGGLAQRVTLSFAMAQSPQPEVDVAALDDCLNRLAELNARQARIVELRFFADLTVKQVSELLGVSESTVSVDWRFARAWLNHELAMRDA